MHPINGTKEVEEVDLKIKYKDQVRDIYDIPVDIKNCQLIGEVLSVFFPACELKLPEQRSLTVSQPNFDLNRWRRRTGNSESVVRAVLKLDEKMGVGSDRILVKKEDTTISEEVEELKNDIKELKQKLSKKNRTIKESKERISELESEICVVKKEKDSQISGLEKKFKLAVGLQRATMRQLRQKDSTIQRLKGELMVPKNLNMAFERKERLKQVGFYTLWECRDVTGPGEKGRVTYFGSAIPKDVNNVEIKIRVSKTSISSSTTKCPFGFGLVSTKHRIFKEGCSIGAKRKEWALYQRCNGTNILCSLEGGCILPSSKSRIQIRDGQIVKMMLDKSHRTLKFRLDEKDAGTFTNVELPQGENFKVVCAFYRVKGKLEFI